MQKKQLTNWQAIGVGALVGFAPLLLALLSDFLALSLKLRGVEYDYGIYLWIFFGWPAIPGGVIGAVIGKNRKENRTIMWVGAIVGAILGVLIWIGFASSGALG